MIVRMWARAAAGTGAGILAVNGVLALRFGLLLLRLPMEAGGLLLGPFVGLPLVGFGLAAGALAVGLVAMPDRVWSQAAAALVVALAFDAFALMS